MPHLRTLIRLAMFAVRNPSVTLHNINPQKIRKLFEKFRQNDDDLSQWLDVRLPEPTPTVAHSLEKVSDKEALSFPELDEPLVSIIIPVFNHADLTLSLLKSILRHTPPNYEIIIADDASTEDIQTRLSRVQNIRVLRNPDNIGFLLNCNKAAFNARGRYLLFLNNDTNVTPGWLEALLSTFRAEDIGIVGPKILFQTGKLQEAGGIVWRDGSAWNYGRMADPSLPEFNYVKDVDYVSGCCLAIRRELWLKAGGFDTSFAPAYYEDTDLCFTARALGYRVLYQPESRIVHLEGASHGTKTNQGIKKHQTVNQRHFADKWHKELTEHAENGTDIFRARERAGNKKTVVFIDQLVPHYDQDAGSRAVYMILQTLLECHFKIIFIPHSFIAHQPYTHTLQQLGIEVLYGPKYSSNIYKWLVDNKHNIDILFFNRPLVASDYLSTLNQGAWKKIFFGHDLHFLRMKRESDVTANTDHKKLKKMEEAEINVARAMDVVYYPSSLEVSLLQEEYGIKQADVLPLFIYPENDPDVPNYRPMERKGLLFVGSFSHPPNTDAVLWYYNNILPLITPSAGPTYIVGSNPPKHIKALDSERLKIMGRVSDQELSALYSKVRLVIVPLRFGAGVKGKVLEAMHHGLPLVSTSTGIEGIPEIESFVPGTDTESDFAGAINDLCENETDLILRSEKGKALIARHFNKQSLKTILMRDLQ